MSLKKDDCEDFFSSPCVKRNRIKTSQLCDSWWSVAKTSQSRSDDPLNRSDSLKTEISHLSVRISYRFNMLIFRHTDKLKCSWSNHSDSFDINRKLCLRLVVKVPTSFSIVQARFIVGALRFIYSRALHFGSFLPSFNQVLHTLECHLCCFMFQIYGDQCQWSVIRRQFVPATMIIVNVNHGS